MSEQAVLVRFFSYGTRFFEGDDHDLSPMHQFGDELAEIVESAGVGEYDGHELALDGSDGTYFFYGADARAIFAVIEMALATSPITYDAEVTLRFGAADEPTARLEVVQLVGPPPATH